MNIQQLFEELEHYCEDVEVFIEINGTAYRISGVTDDSQGIYLNVDEALEERDMR